MSYEITKEWRNVLNEMHGATVEPVTLIDMKPRIFGAPLVYDAITRNALDYDSERDDSGFDSRADGGTSADSSVYTSLTKKLLDAGRYVWNRVPDKVKVLGVLGVGVSGCVAFNQPPIAELDYSADGRAVTFNASGSYDKDGNITKYEFEFGDGRKTVSGPVYKHMYDKPGNYTAKVIVTDDKNATGSKEVRVEAKKLTPALKLAKELGVSGKYQLLIEEKFDVDEKLSESEKNFINALAKNSSFSDAYFDRIAPLITENTSESDVKMLDYAENAGKYGESVVKDLFDDLNTNRSATLDLITKNSGLDIKYRLIEGKYLDIDGDGIKDRDEKGVDKFLLNYAVDFNDTNNSFAVMNIPVGWSKTYDGYTWNVSEEKYPDGLVRVDLGRTKVPSKPLEDAEERYVILQKTEQYYPEFHVKAIYPYRRSGEDISHIIRDGRNFLMPLGIKDVKEDSITLYVGANKNYLEKNENGFKVKTVIGRGPLQWRKISDVEERADQEIYYAEKTEYFNDTKNRFSFGTYEIPFLNLDQRLAYYDMFGRYIRFDDTSGKTISQVQVSNILYVSEIDKAKYEELEISKDRTIVSLDVDNKRYSENWDTYPYILPTKRDEYKIVTELRKDVAWGCKPKCE